VSTRKSCVTCQLNLVVVCGSFVFEAQEMIGSYVETIEKTALYFPASLKGGRVERWRCMRGGYRALGLFHSKLWTTSIV